MNDIERYRTYKKEVGKDVLKALAFFFIGIPVGLFLLTYLFF